MGGGGTNGGSSENNEVLGSAVDIRRTASTDSVSSADSSDSNHDNASALSHPAATARAQHSAAHSSRNDSASNAGNSNDDNAAMWKEDLSNLLTPQTVLEQAQVRRRKRNREAARRSRQRQKERERELVERQVQLSERLAFLEQELVEWRMINSTTGAAEAESTAIRLIDPAEVSGSEDGALAENINSVYALTMETLHIIGELQLQLDEITKELNSMMGSE